MGYAGDFYLGSLVAGKKTNGLLIDIKKGCIKYSTFSSEASYRGFIRHIYLTNEKDSENLEEMKGILYVGSMKNKKPDGIGLIAISSKLVLYGSFSEGVPKGRCYYFEENGSLYYLGYFNSAPIFGTCYEEPRRFEGKLANQPTTLLNFGKYPIRSSDMSECLKIPQAMKGIRIEGKISNFNDVVHEVIGNVQRNQKDLNGFFEVRYLNKSRYTGWLVDGKRQGAGYFVANEGQFQLFGDFNAGKSLKGYMVISEEKSYPMDNSLAKLVYPKVIFGEIQYSPKGQIQVIGNAKAVLTNDAVYFGQFLGNSITGYGKTIQRNRATGSLESYKGQHYFSKRQGIGRLETPDFKYDGEFFDDLFHGFGIFSNSSWEVKGRWSKGYCLYASITFQQKNPQAALFGFESLNIIFDIPYNGNFEISQLSGHVEFCLKSNLADQLMKAHEILVKKEIADRESEMKVDIRSNAGSLKAASRNDDAIPYKKLTSEAITFGAYNAGQMIQSPSSRRRSRQGTATISPYKRTDTNPHNTSENSQRQNLLNTLSPVYNVSARLGTFGEASNQLLKKNTIKTDFSGEQHSRHDDMMRGYCVFEGRLKDQTRGESYTLTGTIRSRSGEYFCSLSSKDFSLDRFIGYMKNSREDQRHEIHSAEVYGYFTHFLLQGVGISENEKNKLIGYFEKGKPHGLIIKQVNNVEDYFGMYEGGVRHGIGLKQTQKSENSPSAHLLLYDKEKIVWISRLEGKDQRGM